MCRELFQVARRPATDQIVGRRDDAHRTFAELANRELGSTQRTDPDGEVGALLQEIDYLIRQRDIERDLRVLRQKGWQQLKQIVQPEGHVGVNAHAAARRRASRGASLGFVDVRQRR